MTWQEAYEQYKASRPPVISTQQLDRLRRNTINVLKVQNESRRVRGLKPLYRLPAR